jgi:hypothetical protein
MTTEILAYEVFRPSMNLSTTGMFDLSRALTQDEYDFLQTGIKNKFKRVLNIRNAPWVNDVIKRSLYSEDLVNILSFVSFVGKTFIKLDTKGIATPERVTSAINGLEELFLLHVFNRTESPVEVVLGSATFRISDTEFYRVFTDGDGLKVQSGELVPIWNQPVDVGPRNQ